MTKFTFVFQKIGTFGRKYCKRNHSLWTNGNLTQQLRAYCINSVAFAVTNHSDINHAKKGIDNDLYAILKSYKVHSTKVSTYSQNCYSYALVQNKDDKVGTERALRNIISRVFGDHRSCVEWVSMFRRSLSKICCFSLWKTFTRRWITGGNRRNLWETSIECIRVKGEFIVNPKWIILVLRIKHQNRSIIQKATVSTIG